MPRRSKSGDGVALPQPVPEGEGPVIRSGSEATHEERVAGHRRFLARTSHAVLEKVDKLTGGHKYAAYRYGPSNVVKFASHKEAGGKRRRVELPLDLTELGLPSMDDIPSHYASDAFVPIAVIGHQRGGEITGMQLLISDGEQVRSLYLERDASGRRGTERWVAPGRIEATYTSIDTHVAVHQRAQSSSHAMLSLLSTEKLKFGDGGADGDEAQAFIIRRAPSRDERTAANPYHDRKPSALRRAARTAVAATATVAAAVAGVAKIVPKASDPHKNAQLTSASSAILTAGTSSAGGVEQAEQFFKEPELLRVQDAIDAYFRGDQAALRQQMEASNFHPNWIPTEAIATIEKAQTHEEIEVAFNAIFKDAFSNLTIRLIVCNEEPELKNIGNSAATVATDVERTRQLALSIITLYNMFDRRMLDNNLPDSLDYMVVGTITTYQDRELGGYYLGRSDEYTRSRVVLSEIMPADELVGHETTHYMNMRDVGVFSRMFMELNPDGYSYVGANEWQNSSTVVDGWNVAFRSYANASSDEDAAVMGERLLAEHPELVLENSPLSEKLVAMIAELEKQYPGFTASLMQRATVHRPSVVETALGATLFETQRYGDLAFYAAALTMMFALGRRLKAAQSRRVLRRYGLPGGWQGVIRDAQVPQPRRIE